jgi:hypothetical protein
MLWKRKDSTRAWQPEDEVVVTGLRLDGDNIRVDAVYKGQVYHKSTYCTNYNRDPEYAIELCVDNVKRGIVNEYRCRVWWDKAQKAVSSYPVAR